MSARAWKWRCAFTKCHGGFTKCFAAGFTRHFAAGFTRHFAAGFTLVELLVAIAIIGVLVALLLPVVQAARESARRMSCSNNLKQSPLACQGYHDAHNVLPPGRLDHRGAITWAVQILPYLEQDNLFKQWDITRLYYDQGPNVAAGDTIRRTTVKTYLCPSRQRQAGAISINGDTPDTPFSGSRSPRSSTPAP